MELSIDSQLTITLLFVRTMALEMEILEAPVTTHKNKTLEVILGIRIRHQELG